jgi:predicted transcriptional regulator of viral defense system
MSVSVKKKILQRMEAGKEGQIYFSEDFIDIANNEQVRLALSRLAKDGEVIRLGHGIYVYPKTDPLLGKVRPSLADIAQAIAQRDKIAIKPTGAYALNRIGLSTQVPMKVVFLTNGDSRTIKIGKNTIQFRKTSSKKMAYQGEVSPLIIQSLEEIGKEGLTPAITEHLRQLLNKEDFQIVRENLKLAPRWIAETLLSILNNK